MVAVAPQPDFGPYFLSGVGGNSVGASNENGTQEPVPSTEVMKERKRRGSETPSLRGRVLFAIEVTVGSMSHFVC